MNLREDIGTDCAFDDALEAFETVTARAAVRRDRDDSRKRTLCELFFVFLCDADGKILRDENDGVEGSCDSMTVRRGFLTEGKELYHRILRRSRGNSIHAQQGEPRDGFLGADHGDAVLRHQAVKRELPINGGRMRAISWGESPLRLPMMTARRVRNCCTAVAAKAKGASTPRMLCHIVSRSLARSPRSPCSTAFPSSKRSRVLSM